MREKRRKVMEWFFIILGIIILIAIISNIRIVPQTTRFVIERLGAFKKVWAEGIHVKIPIIDRVAMKISVKEQVLDTPPQPVITKDNVTMQIDAVVFYKISDPKLYAYGVMQPLFALSNLTATTLRNIVGEMSLDESLTSRDLINGKMTVILDEATDPWGIKVTRVELKNIAPPKEIRDSMEKEMKAERDRRETLLQAEGHKAAAITRAEGDKQAAILAAEGERDARIARAEGEAKAKILEKQAEAEGLRLLNEANPTGAVIELKRYETLQKLADGKAAKIIVPTDIVDTTKKNVYFSEMTELGAYTAQGKPDPEPQKKDECCEKFSDDPEYSELMK